MAATQQISSWSHSKESDFTKCKFLAKLKHIDRIPEPERPLPPGKTEHANDRGSRVHDHAENFVNGKFAAQLPEMRKFEAEFNHLRHLYAQGLVSLEGEWALDEAWSPVGWNGEWRPAANDEFLTKPIELKNLPAYGHKGEVVRVAKVLYEWVPAWHRSKIDALVMPRPEVAIVIDYKTGKRFGNEIKHAEQTQLYALNTVMRFPLVEEVHTELWYTDVDDLAAARFTRDQILRFKTNWDKRGHAVTDCTNFPPNPNLYSCQWCQYGPWNSGHCTVGVRREK